MNYTEKFTIAGIIVTFGLLFMFANHRQNNWLPPSAKIIRVINDDWKLIEINGQKYQLNSLRRLCLPYQP